MGCRSCGLRRMWRVESSSEGGLGGYWPGHGREAGAHVKVTARDLPLSPSLVCRQNGFNQITIIEQQYK